jgi:predicted N-acyltransferase
MNATLPIDIRLVTSLRDIPAQDWDALHQHRHPFLCHAWLTSLEDAGLLTWETGWEPRYLLAWHGPHLRGALPMYLKQHSFGEFVYDWAWARLAEQLQTPYYPKLVVTTPFSPVGGPRLLVHPTLEPDAASRVASLLVRQARDLVDGRTIHGLHLLFLPEAEALQLGQQGWLTRVAHQYHWHNQGYRDFDHFLERFRSHRRKEIRRERRRVEEAGARVRALWGHEVTSAELDLVFAFYHDTCQRYMGGNRYLNRRFFQLVHERMPGQLRVLLAENAAGDVIAGTFNLQSDEAMWGRYWGCREDIPLLHFETCYYRMIELAIADGVQRIEPGAGGDHKFARGFEAVATWSAHWLHDPQMMQVLRTHLRQERAWELHELEHLARHSALKDTP